MFEKSLLRIQTAIDNFRFSNTTDEIFVRVASWTLDQHYSMKICDNPENICPGLWILNCILTPWDIFLIHKYKNLHLVKMKLGKDIWLPISWSNPYKLLTTVVQHCRLDHGRGLSRVCIPNQDGNTNFQIIC